jgi:hypothetical protein
MDGYLGSLYSKNKFWGHCMMGRLSTLVSKWSLVVLVITLMKAMQRLSR